MNALFHRIKEYPQADDDNVNHKQSANQTQQMLVFEQLTPDEGAVSLLEDAVNAKGFGKHRTECQREASSEQESAQL